MTVTRGRRTAYLRYGPSSPEKSSPWGSLPHPGSGENLSGLERSVDRVVTNSHTTMHRTTTPLRGATPEKPRDTMTSTKTQGVPSPGGRRTKRHSPGRHPRVATWRDDIHELPCRGQIHGSHSCGATQPHSRSLDSTLEVAKRRCGVPDATPEFLQKREPWGGPSDDARALCTCHSPRAPWFKL